MTFDRWNEELPATTPKPSPTEAGLVVHAYYDVAIYAGMPEQRRFIEAVTDEEVAEAAQQMPFATVKFFQLPADEPFFDDLEPDMVLPY